MFIYQFAINNYIKENLKKLRLRRLDEDCYR